jgi:hypothetical protein
VLAGDSPPRAPRAGATKEAIFPLAVCTFHGGLCGAVRRDGTVAIPPRYDWVGPFLDGRAAVRVGGLYGFVDENGREIVKPQYRVVDDYKFGFAQVDVDGKSGLINREGSMAIAPKYAFIEAIDHDRFRVSNERRRLGGMQGGENFSGARIGYTPSGGISLEFYPHPPLSHVVDMSGQLIEPPGMSREFDRHDQSIRWVEGDKLWGLARADGTWVIEPKFQEVGAPRDGLARVTVNGKVGFIDRTGNFAIEPMFDQARWFEAGLGRTSASRDGIFGVIDNTGAWVFQTNYQQVRAAIALGKNYDSRTPFGWHFQKAGRWGLLDLDGRMVLEAEFERPVEYCAEGRLTAYKDKLPLYFQRDGSPLQPPHGRIFDGSCGSPPYTILVGDKFGLIDAATTPLTPVHFDQVSGVGPGGGAKNVKIGGKWGRIGIDGRWLLEPRFDYLSNEPVSSLRRSTVCAVSCAPTAPG